MYFPISWLVVATAVTLLVASSQALNIIVNNDDGFAAANIREFYRLLKAAGHNGGHLQVSQLSMADCVASLDCCPGR